MKTFGTQTIDYRTEHLSLLDINRALKNTKPTGRKAVEDNHHLKDIYLTPIEKAFYVKKVAKGYPLRQIIAFQAVDGTLRLFLTKELKSMLDYLNEEFAIDGVSWSELTDGGRVESIQFEVCVVKPSYKDFDFAVYNS